MIHMTRIAPRVFFPVLALLAFLAAGRTFAPSPAHAANTVDINGAHSGDAYGNSNDASGSNHNGPPDDNILNINSGGSVAGAAHGAYTDSAGTATGNSVNVSGTVTSNATGAFVDRPSAASVSVSDNTANLLGGTVNGILAGGVGSLSTAATGVASATDNHMVGSAGTVAGQVIGGFATTNGSGATTASSNDVIISGSAAVLQEVRGGYALSGGGAASATGNSVTISGGAVSGTVYGGQATTTTSAGGGAASATGNSVTISGGAVSGTVYGGQATTSASGVAASATGNTVTISGSPTFAGSTVIWGGDIGGGTGDAFSGNTLNLKTANLTVAGLGNFEFLNFYLPATLAANQTMLTVTGTADLTDGAGRSSTVNVGIDGSASPLKAGDRVILIDASAGALTGTPANTASDGQGMQGVTLKYAFSIQTLNKQLLAVVSGAGPTVNEQSKALSEGFVSGMGLVNQGADLAAGQGMAEAVGSARRAGVSTGHGLGVFGALSGGRSRYNTGSHVDMRSFSLMTGLALGADLASGHLTLGAFFEYGNGSYDTYNSFSNAASVRGDGDMYHIGGGVLGRMDFADYGPGHIYAEAGFRAGGVHNEYGSSDLRDAAGREAEYESSSAYYGFHLGVGYAWNISEAASLDLYGKYFWTRQEGDSVTLSTGDPVTFKDTDSSRLRLGGRFAYAVNEHVAPYVGAAYEHEFDGKARATTNGYAMDAPSLRGDTGIGEIGLTIKPSQSLPLSFDLGVRGYAGKREGVTGALQVKLEF